MGLLSDYKEKKKKEQEEKAYRERYKEFLKVEDDIKNRMDQIPPDYKGVINKLGGISVRPAYADTILALCYSRAYSAEGGELSKAFEILKPRYELVKQNERNIKDREVSIAIYEMAGGLDDENLHRRFNYFLRASEIEIPETSPSYFRVIPQLCRVEMASMYLDGAGTTKDVGEAKKILSDIIDNGLIPKGYDEYSVADRLLKEILQQEEKERDRENDRRLYYEVIQKKVEELLKENPPKYDKVKEALRNYESASSCIPDEAKLYHAISIWEAMEQNKDLTEEQKKAEKDSFNNIINSVNKWFAYKSAALCYYKSLAESGSDAAKWLELGMECHTVYTIYDEELHRKCLSEYIGYQAERSRRLGVDAMNIRNGAGKDNYKSMMKAACQLVQYSYDEAVSNKYGEEIELWKTVLDECQGDIHSYALFALSALMKDYEENSDYRGGDFIGQLSVKHLKELGDYNYTGDGKNKYLGYLFYKRLLRSEEKKSGSDDILEILNRVISYCIHNDDMTGADVYGDYVIVQEKGRRKASACSRIHAWMLDGNNGYFITDDRPDEDGKYSDHDRINADAFRATVIYDGVLG